MCRGDSGSALVLDGAVLLVDVTISVVGGTATGNEDDVSATVEAALDEGDAVCDGSPHATRAVLPTSRRTVILERQDARVHRTKRRPSVWCGRLAKRIETRAAMKLARGRFRLFLISSPLTGSRQTV